MHPPRTVRNTTRVRANGTLSDVRVTVPGLKIGYGRASTRDQNPAAQHDALTAAGCDQVYVDTASGALTEGLGRKPRPTGAGRKPLR